MIYQRWVIIGTAGSGKTTLANQIAEIYGLQRVELDALYWGPNWSESETEDFREKVRTAIQGDTWVVDGNYSSKLATLVWEQAEIVIWLDYRLPLVMWRLLRRTLRRAIQQEVLWGTNRESLRNAFLSRDSLLLYALRTHQDRRRRFETMLATLDSRIVQVRLNGPKAARDYLTLLQSNATKQVIRDEIG